jgi:shikimate kinase/3-dehydroquinate synthase
VAPVLALAGYMGSGKSSVGRAVANQLGCRFVDLDQEVERELGCGIDEYFGSKGEPAFRDIEEKVLGSILGPLTGEQVVLALGGGTLESAENRLRISQACEVFLLDVGPQESWARVAGSGRPLARDETAFRDLWMKRRSTYEAMADWIIPAGAGDVDRVADAVTRIVGGRGAGQSGLWGRVLSETERSSKIIGGPGALSILGTRAAQACEAGKKLHVFTDTNVMRAWGESVLGLIDNVDGGAVYEIEAGEQSKSVAGLEHCWEWLAGRQARRDDIVVALGGGVVGDLAGLVAATYHRGVGLWQVPTSLLAQVDSSVGGKTAINLRVAKNLVGAFYQPDLVIIDPETLKTLSSEEYVGALGEVVKHALLSSIEDLASLESGVEQILARDLETMSELVRRNVSFKVAVVQEDERELGRRAVLNLGHTTAHALETVLGYGHISHGQAVALGVVVALAVSEEVLGLDQAVRKRTVELLGQLGLETAIDLPAVERLIEAAGHDKKVKRESSGFVGLRGIGDPVWGMDVPKGVLMAAMEVIRR